MAASAARSAEAIRSAASAGSDPFERGADATQFGKLRRAHFRHHGAAPRQGDDHAVLLEPPQRLPHRLGGDAEERCEAAFADLAPWRQRTLHDRIAQAPIGALAEGEALLLGQRREPRSGSVRGSHGQLP